MTDHAAATIDRLLTPDEVAQWLGVSKATIYGWRYLPDDGPRGEGPPGLIIGAKLRFRRADVEEWIEQQRSVDLRKRA